MSQNIQVKGNVNIKVGGTTRWYAKEGVEINSNGRIDYFSPEYSYGEPESPPLKDGVKDIELLTALDDGSANDQSGNLQKGMVFGKTYQFKVKNYIKEEPKNKTAIKWMLKYHSLSQNKWVEIPLAVNGDNIKITMLEKDLCGRFVYVRAYIKDPEKEGELKVWKHNRFRWFDREKINEEVKARKENPHLANQKSTPLCGMAAIMYLFAKKNFDLYKKFVKDLFRTGVAQINDYVVNVNKSEHLVNMNPNENKLYPNDWEGIMPYCDWITFSCIRNQENKVRDYDGEDDFSFDGATLPNEIKKLMKNILNFKEIKDNTNMVFNKGTLLWDGESSSSREVAVMQELYIKGYSIIMFVNTNMIKKTGIKSGLFDTIEHWIVFDGMIGGTITWDEYDFKVFTWGEIRKVIINPEVFSTNFYGYVYGK